MDRRQFLKSSSAGLALSSFLPVLPAAFAAEPKPKRVGLIGTGWYGKCDLWRLVQISPVEIVSLCDVDQKLLTEAADIAEQKQVSKKRPRLYGDYRKMLAEKDLDIVEIATPDHWHALPMIEAVKAGADIYVQKPTSVDIVESQAMLAAARKHGRVVQVGTQRRSTPHLAEARQLIQDGTLGKIGLIEIYCYYHMRNRTSPRESVPPEHFDYEMWTGPAPLRPYNSIVHPRGWRAFTEYGNGIVGDMCIHMLDMVRWMTGLGWPKSVSSTGGIFVDKAALANISDTQSATFAFDGVDVVWQHRTWGTSPDPKYPWGATFYGDKGTLKASVNSYDFTPLGDGQPIHKDVTYELDQFPEDKTEKDLEKHVAPAIRRHMQNLLDCIATRGKPVADIEEGHISTVSCLLANLSMQLGRSLTWNAAKGVIANDADANKLLRRPYRGPWVHPEVELSAK